MDRIRVVANKMKLRTEAGASEDEGVLGQTEETKRVPVLDGEPCRSDGSGIYGERGRTERTSSLLGSMIPAGPASPPWKREQRRQVRRGRPREEAIRAPPSELTCSPLLPKSLIEPPEASISDNEA